MDLLLIRQFFGGKYKLPIGEALLIAKRARLIKLKKNEIIYAQGELVKGLYFIVKGLTYVFYKDLKGKEKVKRFSWAGHITAHFVALLKGEPSGYSARCLEDCLLIRRPYFDFMKMVDRSWILEKKLRRELERQIIEREEKEYGLFMYDATSRYEAFTHNYKSIMNKVPGKLIASYMNVSQETLSRIRAKRV